MTLKEFLAASCRLLEGFSPADDVMFRWERSELFLRRKENISSAKGGQNLTMALTSKQTQSDLLLAANRERYFFRIASVEGLNILAAAKSKRHQQGIY